MCQLQIDWRSVWPQLEEPFEAVQVPGAASARGPGVCCTGIQPGRAAPPSTPPPLACEYLVLRPVLSCLEAFSLCLVLQTAIFCL